MVDQETPKGFSSSYTASIHDKSAAGVVDQAVAAEIESDKTNFPDSPNLAGNSTYVVDWDGPDDPQHPRKYVFHGCKAFISNAYWACFSWAFGKKWAITTMVSAYVFMSPVSSSMMAPASGRIAAEFGITNQTIIALLTSIFLGGYGALPSST